MTLLDLELAYHISRKNNRRSRDLILFEMNYFSRMNKLLNDINNRCFIPNGCYSFIHYRPRPREVFAASVELKIIQTWVDLIIRPMIELELIDRTYNNRVGKGPLEAIKLVLKDIKEVKNIDSKECWIIKYDLKGYFPNVNLLIAYDKLMNLINRYYKGDLIEDLIYCINLACFSNPLFHALKHARLEEYELIPPYKTLYNKPYGTGAAIGFVFWQIMTNLYLSNIDKWFINNVESHYVRFVDDFVIVTNNKEKVLNSIPILRLKLKEINVLLHPTKFYCLHYTKGFEFLGYHIKPGRMLLNDKIVNRALFNANYNGPVFRFLCKINSYIGMLRKGTNKKKIYLLLKKILRDDVIKMKYKILIKNGINKNFI